MLKRWLTGVLCCLAVTNLARADDYPTRPIRIMVGFAAGGGADLLARIVGAKLSERLGQPVIVDNRPGAAGAIAGIAVSRAKPDGYTLWLATQGAIAVNPLLQQPKPYDPSDFAPITMLMTTALQLYVRNEFPAKDFKEFVALVKANPGKYAYASAGIGGPGNMMAELLSREVGLKMRYVPYAGDGLAVNDVLSGVVPIWSSTLAAVHPYLGKVRALITTGEEREPLLPETPTVREEGYPGALAYYYNALMTPKGTPPAVVQKLSATFAAIYKDADTLIRIKAMGIVPAVASPEDTAKYIQADIARWRDVVQAIAPAK